MKNISRCIMVILAVAFLQNTQAQTGRVGIGTTTPSFKLDVYTPEPNTAAAIFGTGGGWGEIRVANSMSMVDLGIADSTAGYAGTKFNADFFLRTNSSPRMTIKKTTGYVGIGTMDPKAPLHIVGASGLTTPAAIKFFNYGSTGSIANAPNWTGSAALFVEGNVCATEAFISSNNFNFSDARIKNIIGRSDAKADLDRLNRIEITRYTLKDNVTNSSAVQTKVIAQQLETVMPEAISYIKNYLPDVMQLSASQTFDASQNTLTIELAKPHQLKVGDRIRCIEENGKELIANVLATPTENSIQFQTNRQPEKLFVYGKEVSDFHVVDYDAIAMLNVSATQEQQRLIEDLQKENAAQKEELNDLYSRLGKLEAALSSNLLFNQNTASK